MLICVICLIVIFVFVVLAVTIGEYQDQTPGS